MADVEKGVEETIGWVAMVTQQQYLQSVFSLSFVLAGRVRSTQLAGPKIGFMFSTLCLSVGLCVPTYQHVYSCS